MHALPLRPNGPTCAAQPEAWERVRHGHPVSRQIQLQPGRAALGRCTVSAHGPRPLAGLCVSAVHLAPRAAPWAFAGCRVAANKSPHDPGAMLPTTPFHQIAKEHRRHQAATRSALSLWERVAAQQPGEGCHPTRHQPGMVPPRALPSRGAEPAGGCLGPCGQARLRRPPAHEIVTDRVRQVLNNS